MMAARWFAGLMTGTVLDGICQRNRSAGDPVIDPSAWPVEGRRQFHPVLHTDPDRRSGPGINQPAILTGVQTLCNRCYGTVDLCQALPDSGRSGAMPVKHDIERRNIVQPVEPLTGRKPAFGGAVAHLSPLLDATGIQCDCDQPTRKTRPPKGLA